MLLNLSFDSLYLNYPTSFFNNHLLIADCPSGYVSYDEHCYGFVEESKTWKEAQDWCKEVGDRYDLVVIDNENENQFLIDHRNKKHIGNQYWIGLKRLSTSADQSEEFAWVHGSDNGFRDWKDRNPDVIL